jgi:hypothetical protein
MKDDACVPSRRRLSAQMSRSPSLAGDGRNVFHLGRAIDRVVESQDIPEKRRIHQSLLLNRSVAILTSSSSSDQAEFSTIYNNNPNHYQADHEIHTATYCKHILDCIDKNFTHVVGLSVEPCFSFLSLQYYMCLAVSPRFSYTYNTPWPVLYMPYANPSFPPPVCPPILIISYFKLASPPPRPPGVS